MLFLVVRILLDIRVTGRALLCKKRPNLSIIRFVEVEKISEK